MSSIIVTNQGTILFINKLLCIVLIFAITSVNVWLIGNLLYWRGIFSKDKKCIITSIAISDLLIGLFCLPVEATLYFQIYLGGPGCTLSYVEVYSLYFSPFVYGMGIVMLIIELILKCKGISFYGINKFLTVFVSTSPWLYALIIIIPLVYSGQPTTCWYLPLSDRGLAIWGIPTFLPILLCLGLWVAAAFIKWKRVSPMSYEMRETTNWRNADGIDTECNQQPSVISPLIENDTTNQLNRHDHNFSVDPNEIGISELNHPPLIVDTYSHSAENFLVSSSSSPGGNFPSFVDSNQAGSPNLHPMSTSISQNSRWSPSYSNGPPTYTGHAEGYGNQTEEKEIEIRREALYLLLIILVYVCTCAPLTLYNMMKLSSYLYGSNSFLSDGTVVTLNWMQVSRSVFIPLLWSVFYYMDKSKYLM